VLSIDAKKNRVVVEHVAVLSVHPPQSAKKYQRRHRQKRGLHQRFHVMVVCASCGKHTRIGHTVFTGWHQVAVAVGATPR